MTPFAVGATVRVLSLGRSGEVVETGRNGRYRVRVAGVILSCRQEDLQSEERSARAGRKARRSTIPAWADASRERPNAASGASLGTIDLHGCTVEEALRALEERLDAALRGGLDHLDVIHGRSSGRIKSAVHRFLKDVSAVRHFAVTPGNPGVTRVDF